MTGLRCPAEPLRDGARELVERSSQDPDCRVSVALCRADELASRSAATSGNVENDHNAVPATRGC